MIIDTTAKVVSFKDETLTLGQLWSLIELLDDEVDDDEDVLAKLSGLNPGEYGRTNPVAYRIAKVSSSQRDYVYCVVEFEDRTWACSCPDWLHRRSINGTNCKHINRVRWS